jgi:hypothetical protein
LDFFYSRFRSSHGGDTGGDVPTADPAASSRPLFFPPAAFVVFDGDGFILQVHGVFTRIRSGLLWWLPTAAQLDLRFTQWRRCALVAISGQDLLGMATAA